MAFYGSAESAARKRRFGRRARSSGLKLGKAKQGNVSTVPRLQHGVGEIHGGSITSSSEPELEELWQPRILIEAEVVFHGLCGFEVVRDF